MYLNTDFLIFEVKISVIVYFHFAIKRLSLLIEVQQQNQTMLEFIFSVFFFSILVKVDLVAELIMDYLRLKTITNWNIKSLNLSSHCFLVFTKGTKRYK